MKNVTSLIWIILAMVSLVFGIFAFYWTQVRPASIRQNCIEQNSDGYKAVGPTSNPGYDRCLHEGGLNE